MNKMQKRSVYIMPLLLLCGLCTVFGIYKSIYYGCDIDESYAITLAYRLVKGDHLFKEMWEVHQTSAIFMAPFIYLYMLIRGGTVGLVVYLRMVGTLVQALVTVFLYFAIKKYVSGKHAFWLSLLFFNFSPKYSQVLEFCFLEYLFMTCMVIALLYYDTYRKNAMLVLAGVFQACSIFAYPQMLLLLPVEAVLLFLMLGKEQARHKKILCFFGAEAASGLLFLIYVLCHVSLSELFDNVPYILSDGSHQLNLMEKIVNHGREILSYLLPLSAGIVMFELAWRLLSKKGEQTRRFVLECFFLTAGLLYALVPVIQKYYTGVRHLDLSYAIIFVSLVLGYLNIRFGKRNGQNRYFAALTGILTGLFFISCFASNMTIYANGGLLVPVMILLWILFLKDREGMFDGHDKKRTTWAVWVPVSILAIYFLSARMTLIRFTAVQPKTIFDKYYTIEVGTAKKLRVTEKEHIMYHAGYNACMEHVNASDSMLFFGSDTYNYFLTGCSVATPTTISTPMYDEAILAYYKKYPYKVPSVILVDKYWQGLDKLLEVPAFGDWVSRNYDLEHRIEEPYHIIIYTK